MAPSAVSSSRDWLGGAPVRLWVWTPIEQCWWCLASVARAADVPSAQNEHPAGTALDGAEASVGAVSEKVTATGGLESSSAVTRLRETPAQSVIVVIQIMVEGLTDY